MRLRNEDDLGQYVRQRRRELGLTQAELGQRAGLRRATVVDVEGARSRPSFATAVALLESLDVTLSARPGTSSTAPPAPGSTQDRPTLAAVLAAVSAEEPPVPPATRKAQRARTTS